MIQILYKHSLLIPSKNSGKTGALAGAFVKRATDQQPHFHISLSLSNRVKSLHCAPIFVTPFRSVGYKGFTLILLSLGTTFFYNIFKISGNPKHVSSCRQTTIQTNNTGKASVLFWCSELAICQVNLKNILQTNLQLGIHFLS